MATSTRTLNTLTLNQTTNTFQFSNASGAASVSAPSLTSAPYRVSVARSDGQSADPDGSLLPTSTTTYQYDAYGNATQVSVVTSDGYSKTVNNTYANDTSHWLLGRLTASSVTSQAPTQLGKICSLPWGATIGDGQSVTAYSAAQPTAGQDCSSVAQTRTCSNGTLSGSYALQTCAALCALPWGGTIGQGQSVTAYAARTVPFPQVCASIAQTRTCGATGVLNGSYVNQSCAVRQTQTIYLTSGTSWAVPADWNNASNKIEVIGGGGGGNGGGGTGNGGGGGGGGYSAITNLTLTPGSTVSYNVGLGGAAAGGNTWFNGSSLSNASVSAQGGGVGWLTTEERVAGPPMALARPDTPAEMAARATMAVPAAVGRPVLMVTVVPVGAYRFRF